MSSLNSSQYRDLVEKHPEEAAKFAQENPDLVRKFLEENPEAAKAAADAQKERMLHLSIPEETKPPTTGIVEESRQESGKIERRVFIPDPDSKVAKPSNAEVWGKSFFNRSSTDEVHSRIVPADYLI